VNAAPDPNPSPLPLIYLARHGETEWSRSGRHTGRSDLPLTAHGEDEARRLAPRLAGRRFAAVFTSPSVRARRTAELAGFGDRALPDPDLLEWDYGRYEGLTTRDIRAEHPDWRPFRDGAPEGETLDALSARADRVVARLRAIGGNSDVLIFSHRDFIRSLTVRWLGLPIGDAALFFMATAALSALGFDHDRDEPVIRLWNDDRHLAPVSG